MSYTFETLDDGHILILTLNADFNWVQELDQAVREGQARVASLDAPIVSITDVRAVHFDELNELLEAANVVRFIKPEDRLNKHPKVIKTLAVISSKLIQLAARGLNSVSFGHMEITMFPTLEETLAQARAALKDAGFDTLAAAG